MSSCTLLTSMLLHDHKLDTLITLMGLRQKLSRDNWHILTWLYPVKTLHQNAVVQTVSSLFHHALHRVCVASNNGRHRHPGIFKFSWPSSTLDAIPVIWASHCSGEESKSQFLSPSHGVWRALSGRQKCKIPLRVTFTNPTFRNLFSTQPDTPHMDQTHSMWQLSSTPSC